MSDLVRLSMSLEKDLHDKMEALVRDSRYTNRSEFLRDLIRKELVENQWEGNRESLATVTIIFDHHAHGLTEKLIDLQHHHMGKVLANLHLHLDAHRCAEVIVVKGKSRDLKRITDEMRSLKGVLHTSVAISAAGDALG